MKFSATYVDIILVKNSFAWYRALKNPISAPQAPPAAKIAENAIIRTAAPGSRSASDNETDTATTAPI